MPESMNYNPNKILTTKEQIKEFDSLVERDVLREVSKVVYKDFIDSYIKKQGIPCENTVNIFRTRKRIGGAYRELRMNSDPAAFESAVGLLDPYEPVDEHEAHYGWIQDNLTGVTHYHINPIAYPSWFSENIISFNCHTKEGETL